LHSIGSRYFALATAMTTEMKRMALARATTTEMKRMALATSGR
jgi:hypothetical protein